MASRNRKIDSRKELKAENSVPMGKALDLSEAATIEKHDAKLAGGNDYETTKDHGLRDRRFVRGIGTIPRERRRP
jgi:hypothetical protein